MIPMRRIPTLPQELIIEIFLCLSVISLMRFRCVSKFFDALVLDSDFTHVHHLRSMTHDGGTKFHMGKIEDLYVVDLNEDENTSRWNSDCHDQYFNGPCEPVIIFNPSTRKMVLLPHRKKNSHLVKSLYYYSLGHELIEKKYKVMMQVHNSGGHIKKIVFTLSKDKSWRKIKNISDFFPCFSMKGCSIKGVIYMMDYSKNSIVVFDLRAEELLD
ncbi:hypothetical protein R3W88_014249 [Solanum pinnatisectum]|uniref:F-box domain-containing protein n=1 Tax=Solanum pinnatisectum TaxID=50273 RepID=A0AAV9KRJ2_9SOLN|nr:hypothetical protein R3W88_014249 [Solanum pinnatisectum]